MTQQARLLRRNIAGNCLGYAVHLAVALILTPFVLHRLGDARYGAWILVISLVGYYGLIDLGARAGLTQSMTRRWGAGDVAGMNRAASTGMVLLGACGVIVVAATCAIASLLELLLEVPLGLHREVWACILLVGVSTAVQLPLFPYAAAFTAAQRLDLANAIGIATKLVSAGGIWLALGSGGGLVAISAVTASVNLVDYLLRYAVSRSILPALRPRVSDVRWSSIREFLASGIWNSIVLLGVRLIWYTDAILIGLMLPLAAVGRYSLGATLAGQFGAAFVPLGQAYFPVAARHFARGEMQELVSLYLSGTRLAGTLATALGVIAAVMAESFYRLWVGESIAQGGGFHAPSLVFRVLLVAAVVTSWQRIGYQVLLAMNRPQALALLLGGEALANLALSLALIHPWGLLGVALGTMLPALVFEGLLQPWLVCRMLGLAGRRYARRALLPGLAVALVQLPAAGALASVWQVHDWMSWCSLAFAELILAMVCLVAVGVSAEERRKWIEAAPAAARLGAAMNLFRSKGVHK